MQTHVLQAYADDNNFPDNARLTFRAHDGSLATMTVSERHMMQVITDEAPKAVAATPKECKSPTSYMYSSARLLHVACLDA